MCVSQIKMEWNQTLTEHQKAWHTNPPFYTRNIRLAFSWIAYDDQDD